MTIVSPAPPILGAPCQHCGMTLVSERQAEPWCAACGWNLDAYDVSRRQAELRWKWADKLSFQAAYDLNESQFATLSGRAVDKPGFSAAKFVILIFSFLGLAFDIGLAVFGVWLILHFGTIVPDVLGAVGILIAFALRPRLGKLGKYADPINLESLPAMDRLITRIATEIGAPKPTVLLFDPGFNAGSGTYGLRRRRFISIGLGLWLSLTPQEQAALLGHELAHFVNGDVRRGPLTLYAFQLLGGLTAMTRPDTGASRYRGQLAGGGMAAMIDVLLRPIFALLSLIFGLLQLGVEWITMRASHHAEYAADAMAARVAGSAAMSSCLDALVLDDACETVVTRAARTGTSSPAAWRAAAADARVQLAPRVLRLRQLSMRETAALSHSHPPLGLRARLVESRSQQYATIVVSEAESAEVDRELASQYQAFRMAARG